MLDIPFFRREDSLLEATRQERQEAIQKLISQGSMKSGYYLLLVLATLIVTSGLLLDNVSVIIGGMILAPLMVPLLLLSLSLVAGNTRGIIRSLSILAISIVITVATSGVLTLILARAHIVVSWIPEQITPGVYVLIAFCSGTAGAFALVKENLAPTIAGVAIAVSLLPPLSAIGIGFALGQQNLVQNSSILLLSNLFGMCVAAFLVFWVLGFLSAGAVEEKVIQKNHTKK